MKVIAYSRPDGGTSIVVPLERRRVLERSATYIEARVPPRWRQVPIPGVLGPDGRPVMRKIMESPETVYRLETSPAVYRSETEDEAIARLLRADVPADATAIQVIDAEEVPADRTFRDALVLVDDKDAEHHRYGSGRLGHDMRKSREIHMGRIRAVRNRELERLDVEQLKGRDVAAEKQRLRDLPATVKPERARTPVELRDLWPDSLPKPGA